MDARERRNELIRAGSVFGLLGLFLFASGCQFHVVLGPQQTTEQVFAQRVKPQKSSATVAQHKPAPSAAENVIQASTFGPDLPNESLPTEQPPAIQIAWMQQTAEGNGPLILFDEPETNAGNSASPAPLLPSPEQPPADSYAIDLATALSLAGANNLQIALAAERVREAHARLDGAEALWIPSINAGVGYNKHDGRLQQTEGDVIEVSRGSTFVGGGANLGGAPLTGASSGPARLFVDISPVDIFFEPLAARQSADAAHADETVSFNDTLLRVTIVYLELVRGQTRILISEETVKNAQELLRLTENFARAGAGLEADAARARADLANRRRQLFAAQEDVDVVATELARLLRLDHNVVLFAVESQPVPLEIVSEQLSLDDLVGQGLTSRPELARHQALVSETLQRMRQEKWRPWIPNLHLGASAGGFGGGQGSFFGNFSDRSDFDILAVWELRNLGLGNRAVQRERSSQHRQAHLAFEATRDLIVAQIARAYQQVQHRRKQIEQARLEVESAAVALPLNFNGIRGRELRAIEAQQAIAALAGARNRYLETIIGYNQAQFRLLRALGQPPETMLITDEQPELELVPVPEPAVENQPVTLILDSIFDSVQGHETDRDLELSTKSPLIAGDRAVGDRFIPTAPKAIGSESEHGWLSTIR